MKYLKVVIEEPEIQVFSRVNKRLIHNGILVRNELLTQKEFDKQYKDSIFISGVGHNKKQMYKKEIIKEVEVPKNRVYFFFGARFSALE